MLEHLLQFIGDHSYFSLTLTSFLHGVGLPIPVETLLLATLALTHQQSVKYIPAVLLICAADSLGIIFPYTIGYWGGTTYVQRIMPTRKKQSRWLLGIRQYGALAVLATRIGGFMRYACLLMSGAIGLPLWQVTLATFVGGVIYTLLGSAVVELGWRAVKYYEMWIIPPILIVAIWLVRRRQTVTQ